MSDDVKDFLNDFHWLMDVLQDIDVGLVILNKKFEIELWNSFMQNHSARMPDEVLHKGIFGLFPELPEAWFRRKVESVFMLQNSAFTTWEQRPYLFRFASYRPITSIADFMYQNSTIIPLTDTRGHVEHICIIIYDVTEVAVNRLQLQNANEKLHTISRTDGLTGLLNRKAWQNELEQEYARYKRHKHPCSMVMFDIDHFKRVNDTYGHPAGDEVIRQTATSVINSLREIDISGRYGGEEFAIVLPDTDAEGAKVVCERIRKKIQALRIHYEDFVIEYTISLGISELNPNIKSADEWLEHADKGLYEAKEGGRNKTVIYSP